jgi:uncharacterized OsmC-like protein
MVTLIGITAESKGIELGNVRAEIEKVMYSDPRRVGEIHITLYLQEKNYSQKEKSMLENASLTCPVAKSLHPDIKQVIEFVYSK